MELILNEINVNIFKPLAINALTNSEKLNAQVIYEFGQNAVLLSKPYNLMPKAVLINCEYLDGFPFKLGY